MIVALDNPIQNVRKTYSFIGTQKFILVITSIGFCLGVLAFLFGVIQDPLLILMIGFGSFLAAGLASTEYHIEGKIINYIGEPKTILGAFLFLGASYLF